MHHHITETNIEKHQYILLALIIALFAIITIPLFLGVQTNMSQDPYWYASLAEHWFENGNYSTILDIPHQVWPPGYPALIIASHLITGTDYLLSSRLVSLFFGFLTILLAFLWGRKHSPTIGVLTAFFTATFSGLVTYGLFGLTETSFIFFAFLGAFLILENPLKTNQDKGKYALGFILMGLSVLIRYTGFIALAAVVLVEFWPTIKHLLNQPNDAVSELKKKKWTILGGILSALVLVPWVLRNWSISKTILGAGYAGQQTNPFSMDIIFGLFQYNILFVLLVMIGAVIYWQHYRKPAYDFLVFFSIFFMIMHIWWGYGNARFFLSAVIPMAFFLAILVQHVWTKLDRKQLAGILFVLILATQVMSFEGLVENYYQNSLGLVNPKLASEWINENIGANELVAVTDMSIFNYYLQREEFETVFNYNVLLGGDGTLPNDKEVIIVADQAASWYSKIVYQNADQNALVLGQDPNTGTYYVRQLQKIKSFDAIHGETPLFKNAIISGKVDIFRAGPVVAVPRSN